MASLPLSELSEPSVEVHATHMIVIEFVGEDDRPVPGLAYRLLGPDGRSRTGRLDRDGRAEIDDLGAAGDCTVWFPDLDDEAWDYVSAVPL